MENQIEESKIQESTRRNWVDMPYDILIHIFAFLCMTDLMLNVSGVCRSWRTASADPIFWKTLDFELFARKFYPNSSWVERYQHADRFRLLFKSAVRCSCGNLTKLIMSEGLVLDDAHLIYVAERSPNLEFLVLPTCLRITESGLTVALRRWPKLEMLSISFFFYTPLLLEDIGKLCKNISAIKLVHALFYKDSALAMIKFLPGLKIITLRCRCAEKEAVEILLDNLQNLEQLYISDRANARNFVYQRTRLPIEDDGIIKKASRLQDFHVCQNGHCRKCPTAPDKINVIKESF